MAHMIFSHIVKQNNMEQNFYIDSAGTSGEEEGSSIYYLSKDILMKNNIPILDHKARKIKESDISNFDYIICFDNNNINTLYSRFYKTDKIELITNYINNLDEVIDPWYYGNFEECYCNIYEGCYNLFKKLI